MATSAHARMTSTTERDGSGWVRRDVAELKIEERTPFGGALDFRHEERAVYVLRYLPDTDELALIRGDEIIYSEPVPQGPTQKGE